MGAVGTAAGEFRYGVQSRILRCEVAKIALPDLRGGCRGLLLGEKNARGRGSEDVWWVSGWAMARSC